MQELCGRARPGYTFRLRSCPKARLRCLSAEYNLSSSVASLPTMKAISKTESAGLTRLSVGSNESYAQGVMTESTALARVRSTLKGIVNHSNKSSSNLSSRTASSDPMIERLLKSTTSSSTSASRSDRRKKKSDLRVKKQS